MKKRRTFLAGLSIVLGLVAVGGLFSLFGRPVHADSFTLSVTDVADVGSLTTEVVDSGHGAAPGPVAIPLFTPGDCTVTSTLDSGAGSLRDCMAQLGAGDVITFDTAIFPPGNPQTITLNNPLPTIVTDNVTVDGSNAGVILDGSGTPADTSGLVIDGASNVVIKGLQILNFTGNGIELRNGASNNTIGGSNATPGGSCSSDCNLISGNGGHGVGIWGSGTMSNTVSGNYIGTNISGTAAISNTWSGIWIITGAQYNVIGGDTAGERNLISGNGDDGVLIYGSGTMSNTVSGNYIGTDANGTAAISNAGTGVWIGEGTQHNLIGGDTAGERNLISGNGRSGVTIESSGTMSNTVSGNYIGTNATGTVAIGNVEEGILINEGAQYNVIGGNTAGERNLISGNGGGVSIKDSGTMSNTVSGNYVGTNASGTAAISNTGDGVSISHGAQYNVIGGDTAGERNLISGNGNHGVRIRYEGTTNNTIKGNYIGTDASGTTAIPNGRYGVYIREGPSHNVIGGNNATPGGTCTGECNLISGNGDNGVTIKGSDTMSNSVSGNHIGTNISGTAAISNAGPGVWIGEGTQHNLIGGDTASERNLISGNGDDGVHIFGSGTMSNTVSGNYIGTDANGTVAIGNSYRGVFIVGGAQYNVISNNLISGNGNDGVPIEGSGTMSNTVSGNYIGTNASGTAAVSNALDGIYISNGAQYNVISNNLISGNGHNGVQIRVSGTMSNTVSGNYIGTNASGTGVIGNSYVGISIENGAQFNLVGGDNATPDGACTGECNLVSGNGGGVWIQGSTTNNNTVSGNYVGTDVNGAAPLGNQWDGIYVVDGQHNVIGGETPAERNLVSSNGFGMMVRNPTAAHNVIRGNYIGTDASGTADLGNLSYGIAFRSGAHDNLAENNLIAYTKYFTDVRPGPGILVLHDTSLNNTLRQNQVYSNADKGILLREGGNLELFPPIITDLLTDRVSGIAPPNSTVEIFSDDEDEGRVFEGSTTADATSHFTFTQPSGLAGPNTTATATDVDGNTSEFSTAYSVTHDMTLVAIFSVKSRVQVGGAVTPTVEVGNAGSSTEVNVPVQVRVTTDPGGTEVYSRTETVDSISPLAYAFVTFDAWTPGPGNYAFEASVLLPGDENGANDTRAVAVTAVVGNPEVYIKDNPQDDGSVPTSNYWMSPDIWVRHAEDGGEEHQQPIANQTNYAYARIHNIGDATLDNVTVDLYWHEPALAIKCGGWRYIGQYTILSLAPGITETIHLPWTPDVSGHTCLFAQVDSDQDPYSRDHDCWEGVPWDNNLAQRNVEVVESAAAEVGAVSVAGIRLEVINVRSKPASVDVVVEKTGAFTGTLTLDLGEELFNRWQNATEGTVKGGQVVAGTTKVQITAPVSGTVVGLPLYGDEEIEVVLEAEGQSGLQFGVDVKEWMDGLLIGGNTYWMKLPYQDIYLPIILKGHSGS